MRVIAHVDEDRQSDPLRLPEGYARLTGRPVRADS